jgi:hypothetical protein
MKNLNEAFLDYNDQKRIRKSVYDDMKEKIDIIVDEMKSNEDTLSFSIMYLGSYATKTGVEYNDKDYDIDVAIRLNIKENKIDEYDANEQKKSIYESIRKLRKRSFHTMCVSAKYFEDEKPKYHIDFPVYAFDAEKSTYYIAKGKQDEVEWEKCEPDKLTEYLVYASAPTNKLDAYRRTIRYLKVWKNYVFSNEKKYCSPPSIAINLTARIFYASYSVQNEIDNLLNVSKELLKQISSTATLNLPYVPNSNVFEKMNSDLEYVKVYKAKLNHLIDKLEEAKSKEEYSLEEACKTLREVLPDFPLPDKEITSESFAPTGSYGK